jgi:nucleoside-triphosphatase
VEAGVDISFSHIFREKAPPDSIIQVMGEPSLLLRKCIYLDDFVQPGIMTIMVLTGAPGAGKTTAVIRVARALKEKGVKVGGIVSREVRTNNRRIGFEFIDLTTDDRRALASIAGNGPKVGKYFVNVAGCRFAAERLTNAVRNSDVIICDEIGPMELKSNEFIDSVKNLLHVDKKVIVVVHQKLQHPLIDEFRNKSSLLINLDLQNREKVNEVLLDKLIA